MKHYNRIKNFDAFRPLKDFEDQIDEVFARREMKVCEKSKKSRHKLRSHNSFLIEDDAKEIDSLEKGILNIPLNEVLINQDEITAKIS